MPGRDGPVVMRRFRPRNATQVERLRFGSREGGPTATFWARAGTMEHQGVDRVARGCGHVLGRPGRGRGRPGVAVIRRRAAGRHERRRLRATASDWRGRGPAVGAEPQWHMRAAPSGCPRASTSRSWRCGISSAGVGGRRLSQQQTRASGAAAADQLLTHLCLRCCRRPPATARTGPIEASCSGRAEPQNL